MRRRSARIDDVDLIAAAVPFPGCVRAMLPMDQLALIGFARSEEVLSSASYSDRAEHIQQEDCLSAQLQLITARGKILRFSDGVTAETLSRVFSVSKESFCTFHVEWSEPCPDKPGYEARFSFSAITAERSLVKHLLLKHQASLVLDCEERVEAATSEQERFVYPDEKEIELAEWRGQLTDPVTILEVEEGSGVIYRTKDNILYRDCAVHNAPSVFVHYPWQQRLLRWVRSLHSEVKTVTQSMAFASMESTLNVPTAMLEADDFEDSLKHFPEHAPDGAIPVRELFAHATLMRCVSINRWRRSDPGRYPATENMPDIRYIVVV